MDIGCWLISSGQFKPAKLPEHLLIELCKNLRMKGTEIVHFRGRSIEVEGVYIPARGSNVNLLVVTDDDE